MIQVTVKRKYKFAYTRTHRYDFFLLTENLLNFSGISKSSWHSFSIRKEKKIYLNL